MGAVNQLQIMDKKTQCLTSQYFFCVPVNFFPHLTHNAVYGTLLPNAVKWQRNIKDIALKKMGQIHITHELVRSLTFPIVFREMKPSMLF